MSLGSLESSLTSVKFMRRLTEPDDLERAEFAFRTVFGNTSYTMPFSRNVRVRFLIYPIDYTLLDTSQFAAVAAAASQAGDGFAYLAGFGGDEAGWGGTYGHRLVDLDSYADYKPETGADNLEHFLFSPEGKWGLVTSDGQYAVVGGDERFIAVLRAHSPQDEDQMVRAFVRDWREVEQSGGSVAWMPELLEHIFGSERARELWPEVPE